MGETTNQPFQLSFNTALKVEFQGSRVTSDGGLILVRELDERLGLSDLIAQHITDPRGKNTQFPLTDLIRQSVYRRLAGYEDVNDAEPLAHDPTFRLISSETIWEGGAALTSRVHSFETDLLTRDENLAGLAVLNRELVAKADAMASSQRVVLDLDSTEIPVYGQQEQSAYNGHFETTCYHPLLLFNREGDCLAVKLRPGNVHSAEHWDAVLLLEIERQQKQGKDVVVRADAAFAKPELYEALEERGVKYAIRIPSNDILEREVADLLTRSVGRPSYKPVVRYKSFGYQAASWKTARRVVAKVEFHCGELFPRQVGQRSPRPILCPQGAGDRAPQDDRRTRPETPYRGVAHAADGRSLQGGKGYDSGAQATRASEEGPDSDAVNGAGSGSRTPHPPAKRTHQRNGGRDESTANTRFDLTSITGGNSGLYGFVVTLKPALFVDLHSGGVRYRFHPTVVYRHGLGDEARSMAAARAFGIPAVWAANDHPGTFNSETARAGIPTVGVEMTGAGGCLEEDVSANYNRVLNLLRFLEVLRDRAAPEVPGSFRTMANMFTPCSGYVFPLCAVGDQVQAGTVVAQILSPFGETVAEVTAPHSGDIWVMRHLRMVTAGEMVCAVSRGSEASGFVAQTGGRQTR